MAVHGIQVRFAIMEVEQLPDGAALGLVPQNIGSKDFAGKFFALKILAGPLSAKWLKAKISRRGQGVGAGGARMYGGQTRS